MRGAEFVRNDRFCQRAPESFLPRPAEYRFSLRIPTGNNARSIHPNHTVERGLDNQACAFFAGEESFLCPFAVRDVGRSAKYGIRLTRLVPQRAFHRNKGVRPVITRYHYFFSQYCGTRSSLHVHPVHCLGKIFGEQVVNALADDSLAADMKHLGKKPVDQEVAALQILDVNYSGRIVEDGLDELLALAL